MSSHNWLTQIIKAMRASCASYLCRYMQMQTCGQCTQHADICKWMQTCLQTYAGMWTWVQMLYTDIVSRWSWKGQSMTCHLKDCPTSSMQCDLDVVWLHTNLNGKGIRSKSISMNLEVLWTVVQVRCTISTVILRYPCHCLRSELPNFILISTFKSSCQSS